jgi:hypothetical protein
MTPEIDRVLHEYRQMESGYRARLKPNTMHLSREVIPRKISEAEKDPYDLCLLKENEVAYKDIFKVDAMAKHTKDLFTKEMLQKNIIGKDGKEEELSEYEYWLRKKEFEVQIREDMLK